MSEYERRFTTNKKILSTYAIFLGGLNSQHEDFLFKFSGINPIGLMPTEGNVKSCKITSGSNVHL